TIQFTHPLIGRQNLCLEVTPDIFATEIAKARTFGFLREVEYLHANGLALGGTLDNAVVLDEFGVLNTDGLRYPDEFVRHKLLDFVGDMAIMGLPLQGRFEVFASGHAMNNAFLRHIEDNAADYLEERTLALPESATQPVSSVVPGVVSGVQPARNGLRGQPALA
ncbi:MAG: UDP-3-O-acyl-N-acetylglucosamine deacetylase, partial [Humidesulfovibrio sp.]|nr:UDP-3-O-acyl-N-acetylglucosamine deacetylase [Humidesulfovibrio sp.]